LLLTEAGGHVGFTSASDSLWLERRILEAIRQFD
jgi:predicted alpha/beta-fold hydrolase